MILEQFFVIIVNTIIIIIISGAPRAKRARGTPWVNKSTHPRKFGNHVTDRPTDRPSAPQANQCKISGSL